MKIFENFFSVFDSLGLYSGLTKGAGFRIQFGDGQEVRTASFVEPEQKNRWKKMKKRIAPGIFLIFSRGRCCI